MTTPQPPIAGADKWLATMERAAYQCQCEGGLCGKNHGAGRCDSTDSKKHRLVCISFADTLIDACTDSSLTALCRPCHVGWKRQLAKTNDDASGTEVLF